MLFFGWANTHKHTRFFVPFHFRVSLKMKRPLLVPVALLSAFRNDHAHMDGTPLLRKV